MSLTIHNIFLGLLATELYNEFDVSLYEMSLDT